MIRCSRAPFINSRSDQKRELAVTNGAYRYPGGTPRNTSYVLESSKECANLLYKQVNYCLLMLCSVLHSAPKLAADRYLIAKDSRMF
jgi:hypothetical protein